MSMNNLVIEPTKKTPWIMLEPGKIRDFWAGQYSENPGEFYRPVHEWVSKYIEENI